MGSVKWWYVYGLMSNITNWICYIGLTENPKARYNQHKYDPQSSANHLFNREGEIDPTMVLINKFQTKAETRLFEANLIHSGIGCSNREYKDARLWKYLREIIGDERASSIVERIHEEAMQSLDDEFDPAHIEITAGYKYSSEDDGAKQKAEGK